jgi:hypothetical protein
VVALRFDFGLEVQLAFCFARFFVENALKAEILLGRQFGFRLIKFCNGFIRFRLRLAVFLLLLDLAPRRRFRFAIAIVLAEPELGRLAGL